MIKGLIQALIDGQPGAFNSLVWYLQNKVPADDPIRITTERELVKHFGLYAFSRLAWHLIEPGREYVDNWHIPLVCRKLEQVSAGEIKKLICCIPPGCMKSLIFSTTWPAWEWTFAPHIRSLYGSYAQDVANKNAKLHRDIVASKWYQDRWPTVTLDQKASKQVREFENNHKGARFTRSVGSSVTGFHADRINFDDLVNAKDARGKAAIDAAKIQKANAFWFESCVSRRASPTETTFVGVMQRMHFQDTAGMCIDEGYEVLCLPMAYDPRHEHVCPEDIRTEEGELLWPDRYPQEVVDELARALGPMGASAQLQQNPAPNQGALFKDEHFRNRWDPETLDYLRVVLTVDCTFKDLSTSDYVVIQAWAQVGRKIALLDQWRGQWDITRTVEAVERARLEYPGAVVYVEDKANGPGVVQILSKRIGMIKEWSPGRQSKEERASAASFAFDCGDVLLPPDELAPWLGDYLTEMKRFPVGKNDDQVDATVMAVLILTGKGLSILDAVSGAR